MMSLDEAIQHCRDRSKSLRDEAVLEINEKLGHSREDCIECAEEHRQLAEWLEELKRRREEDDSRRG